MLQDDEYVVSRKPISSRRAMRLQAKGEDVRPAKNLKTEMPLLGKYVVVRRRPQEEV